jgi:hypothetical protein
MFVRPLRSEASGRARGLFAIGDNGRRRGAALPWFIVCGPVILLALTWALFATTHRHRQEELKIAAESAALAGCNYYMDEVLLTDHPDRFELVYERARAAVLRFASHNRVDGEPLVLDANLENAPDGEVLLGQVPHPFSHDFFLRREKREKESESRQERERDLLAQAGLDAVRVKVERGKTAAAATAWVDRNVIGFRPQGLKPMPVVPLAILSDPFGPVYSACADSWEWAVEARQGSFLWKYDPRLRRPRQCRPSECDDRIPEITVTFSTQHDRGNGRALWIGAEASGDVARQTWEGLTPFDLRSTCGELVLPPDQPLFLPRMKVTKSELEELAEALTGLLETGERRIWMLYSPQFDTKRRDGTKVAGVIGFVAAQVMNVQLHKDQLRVVLQPGMRITDTAITDADRGEQGPRPLANPYVCRVRLLE